jgi:hypothetical protein
MTYDPQIVEVGPCVWRNLDPDVKAALYVAAAIRGPFQAVVDRSGPGQLSNYRLQQKCDPNFWRHTGPSITEIQTYFIKQLSLKRLSVTGVDEAKLESIWEGDPELRTGLRFIFKSPRNWEAVSGKRIFLLLREALPKTGLASKGKMDANSLQIAALSYWMARAWEVEIVEPLTVSPPRAH